jgi:hypothetical protein
LLELGLELVTLGELWSDMVEGEVEEAREPEKKNLD